MEPNSVEETSVRRPAGAPKRILALDGGGVRGIVALAFLERLEALQREVHGGDPDYRLCDDFDLIGGASTGAIIATGLAIGFSASALIDIYRTLAGQAFGEKRFLGGWVAPKFAAEPLRGVLEAQLGDMTLGDPQVRTGLAIVAKRADTGSPWVLHNNPRARYFNPPPDDPDAVANRTMRLVDLLRASTAAPRYFAPERFAVAKGVTGLFVDGGVSPYNNPAFLLTQMATTRAYGYDWPTGPDALTIVSIGTGTRLKPPSDLENRPAALQAVLALHSVMADCSWQTQALMQWLGDCPAPWTIDGEAGTLADERPTPTPLFRYHRYEVLLETDWLAAELGRTVDDEELARLAQIDTPDTVEALLEIGRAAAERQVLKLA